MSPERIYDPSNSNLHGYPLLRYEPSFLQWLRGEVRRVWIKILWDAYGREEIVAWYLHREQHFAGRIFNRIALQILNYIYGP